MDWSRAKTYLIITFLVLDLVLGYQYLTTKQQAQGYVQSYASQLQEVRELLRMHGMILITEVPKETPEMSFLQVSRPKQAVEDILKGTLRDVQMIENDESRETMKFKANEGEFNVTGDGYFSMRLEPTLPVETGNNAKLSAHVMQKLGPLVWKSDLYREDMTVPTGSERMVVRFLQSYDKYPIFSALLEVHLQNSEIILYNQKALEIGTSQERSQRVLSATAALKSITEIEDRNAGTSTGTTQQKEMRVIRDVKLGYYSPNYADADVWYLVPVWRIVTDQRSYYVNAFTGRVENGTP